MRTILLHDILVPMKLFLLKYSEHLLPQRERAMKNLTDRVSIFHLLVDNSMLRRISASIQIFCHFSDGSNFSVIL